MIKAILFDADGVLINSERFSVQLVRDYGISTEKTLPFFNGIFQDCITGTADLKEVIGPFLTEWGWERSVDEFLDYWFKSEHQIDQPLIEYIQTIRKAGIKCYIATNQEKHRVAYMLDRMGFKISFDKVFASAHLGYKKPSRDFYQQLMHKLPSIQKSEVLFWDDTDENVDAARQFGISAELYTNLREFQNKHEEVSRLSYRLIF